jgi:hypothetical protein
MDQGGAATRLAALLIEGRPQSRASALRPAGRYFRALSPREVAAWDRVSASKDVVTKLLRASPWVRDHFNYFSEVLVGYGCESRDEAGPGRAFSLGSRTVLRVHPKLNHLGLGFPDAMRADVESLVGVRAQKGAAWFNYSEEFGDVDTLELLIDESVRLARDGSPGVASPVEHVRVEATPPLSKPLNEHSETFGHLGPNVTAQT